MRKRVLISVSIVLGLFVLALGFGFYFLGSNTISLSPSPSPSTSPSPYPFPTFKRAFPVVSTDWGILGFENVSRGSSYYIDVTVENSLDNQTEAVLTFDTNGMDPLSPVSALNYINATFSAPNPITLQPRETKHLILTVSVAGDAPLGKYLFVAETESLATDGGKFHEGIVVVFTVVP